MRLLNQYSHINLNNSRKILFSENLWCLAPSPQNYGKNVLQDVKYSIEATKSPHGLYNHEEVEGLTRLSLEKLCKPSSFPIDCYLTGWDNLQNVER